MTQSEDKNHYDEIIAEADALIAQAQASLNRSAEFYAELGVDKAVALPALERMMGAKGRAEAERLIAEDEAAVQRDFEERKARAASSGTSSPRSSKTRRRMV